VEALCCVKLDPYSLESLLVALGRLDHLVPLLSLLESHRLDLVYVSKVVTCATH